MEQKITLTDEQVHNMLDLFYPSGICYYGSAWPVLLNWAYKNRYSVLSDVVESHGDVIGDYENRYESDLSEEEYVDNILNTQNIKI